MRSRIVAALAAVAVGTSTFAGAANGATAGPATPCKAIAAQEPQSGHAEPPPAPAMFGRGFPVLHDCEWGFRLGGFGGVRKHGRLQHVPVIFVHGNRADAENWFRVTDQFRAAGYTNQELYAVSYDGLGDPGAGMPVCTCPPTAQEVAYFHRRDVATQLGSSGPETGDDVNVPDVYAFVRAVQAYTGSTRVEIVAHSLGVTIVRKMMQVHPTLYRQVAAAVLIAGANHGTTICRGERKSFFGCDEIAPGTAWLRRLNGRDETPGRTHWMSVYDGHDGADPFYEDGAAFDDRASPHLAGAVNVTFPRTYHNDLRVRPDIVATYLRFLRRYGHLPRHR
jgi:pimeloyl-ACP methyl ester carboxylesterase